jgi:hypothetical protein
MNRRSFLSSIAVAASVGVPSVSLDDGDEIEGELVKDGLRRVWHYQSDHHDYILHKWTVTNTSNDVLDTISARSPILRLWYVDEHQLFVVESPLDCARLSRSYRFQSDISRLRTVHSDGRTEVTDWDAVEQEYVREFDSAASG